MIAFDVPGKAFLPTEGWGDHGSFTTPCEVRRQLSVEDRWCLAHPKNLVWGLVWKLVAVVRSSACSFSPWRLKAWPGLVATEGAMVAPTSSLDLMQLSRTLYK
ncbi:hypothetical protein GOP47_0023194 [Adiantum capillus-veneris]|uniref:Uncharacterized protein n=1 Tax=Adiantum capillus-veneris TaxID=13818 RepID=A0A9D4U7P1_ADICA|nr:hypothetical protein GOP47_0023194 [Adiantum capillus-veneris]